MEDLIYDPTQEDHFRELIRRLRIMDRRLDQVVNSTQDDSETSSIFTCLEQERQVNFELSDIGIGAGKYFVEILLTDITPANVNLSFKVDGAYCWGDSRLINPALVLEEPIHVQVGVKEFTGTEMIMVWMGSGEDISSWNLNLNFVPI